MGKKTEKVKILRKQEEFVVEKAHLHVVNGKVESLLKGKGTIYGNLKKIQIVLIKNFSASNEMII